MALVPGWKPSSLELFPVGRVVWVGVRHARFVWTSCGRSCQPRMRCTHPWKLGRPSDRSRRETSTNAIKVGSSTKVERLLHLMHVQPRVGGCPRQRWSSHPSRNHCGVSFFGPFGKLHPPCNLRRNSHRPVAAEPFYRKVVGLHPSGPSRTHRPCQRTNSGTWAQFGDPRPQKTSGSQPVFVSFPLEVALGSIGNG